MMTRTGLNIYQRKDGRYEGRFRNGIKTDGKPRYSSVYGHSFEEVKEKLEKLRSEQYDNTSAAGLTVHSLFEEWMRAIAPRVKESTLANYRMKARIHLLPAFGSLESGAVSAAMVQNFINEKLEAGLSARYVSDIVVLLKSIFKYAGRTYQMYNPVACVLLPRKKKPEIQILSETEQKKLQAHLLKHQNSASLGIAISLYTGLRLGELCALQWRDIDFEKRMLTVRHTVQRITKSNGTARTQLMITEPKSSSSFRTIPIPECLITFLKCFQAESHLYVVSGTDKPLEPRTMQYRFSAVLRNENLPSVHFHSLRHLFATNCIALEFDVKALSEILGHSSVEITLNRYVHSSMEQKRKYMERISPAA